MGEQLLAGQKVLVMGLGRFGGGVDVVKFACGAGAKVIVTDLAGAEELAESIGELKSFAAGSQQVEYHLGGHKSSDFEQADIVVVNPAVPGDNKFVQIARKAGRRIASQVELFFELCPARIIGITGSNGKSTTSALAAHLLRSFAKKVWLGGNIGNEPMLAIVEQIKPDDLVVLELSSFQIEQLAHSRQAPDVALITNLTPNHLDRYGTFERYYEAKKTLFEYQKLDENRPVVSIFNGEDEICREWFNEYRAQPGRICVKFSVNDIGAGIRAAFGLPGGANLSNLAAAVSVARHFGVTDEQITACLPAFKSLPHRLQFVAESGGVRWFNDSKATTPLSTMAALNAFEDAGIILIAGGYDKGISFEELGGRIAERAKAVVLIGQTAKKIAAAIQANPSNKAQIAFADSLVEAVQSAGDIAVGGDVVILSPACASYDMFENYQQRGQRFTDLVREFGR